MWCGRRYVAKTVWFKMCSGSVHISLVSMKQTVGYWLSLKEYIGLILYPKIWCIIIYRIYLVICSNFISLVFGLVYYYTTCIWKYLRPSIAKWINLFILVLFCWHLSDQEEGPYGPSHSFSCILLLHFAIFIGIFCYIVTLLNTLLPTRKKRQKENAPRCYKCANHAN